VVEKKLGLRKSETNIVAMTKNIGTVLTLGVMELLRITSTGAINIVKATGDGGILLQRNGRHVGTVVATKRL
jgi:hypothetical protein